MTEQPRRRPGFFGGEARSDSSAAPVSLWRFVGPRYWRVWVLIGWLKLVALLPRRASLAFHRALGRRLGRASASATRLIRKNLATCFPELNDAEREAILDEYLANMGAIVAELAIAWFHPPARLERLFDFAGTEHLSRALEGGRGVILVTGHFTPIELCTLGIKRHAPYFALMYNQRRSRLLSEYQRRCRERYADESFPKRDLRALFRSLKRNAVVWYAADEAHTGKSSAWLPFFGEPALTNTALSRIARISGAAVVPMSYYRKEDGRYLIRFAPALDGFPSGDALADTARVTGLLEASIRECPAQYFWKQRRFRGRRDEHTARSAE